MNIYYMNEKLGDNTIIVHNTQPSEYQDLIEDYLANGGKITYCEEGEAEGALRLGRFEPTMQPPGARFSEDLSRAEMWDKYFDLEHLTNSDWSSWGKINNVYRGNQ